MKTGVVVTQTQNGAPWGGFSRRFAAFSIDAAVLSLFFIVLFYLLSIGYGVGLAAHQQVWSLQQMEVFLRIFFFSDAFILAAYFVVLHHMGGRTVGKWVMGLRVVGFRESGITYGQAAVRFGGYLLSSVLGLGFFWILWSREKRGWHDLLAGTWVMRELK